MRFNMEDAPRRIVDPDSNVQIGNVYRNQKGNIYVIVSIHRGEYDSKAVALVVNREGEIQNAICYSVGYFSRFACLGIAHIPKELEIDWIVS